MFVIILCVFDFGNCILDDVLINMCVVVGV